MESLSGLGCSLAAPQRLQCKHNLARLPPQQVLVAAEAIQRERRQLRQAQEAVPDILFCIETELISRCRVRLLCCYQM